MSVPTKLSNLSAREAIADAIYRTTLAYDTNDVALLQSAMTSNIVFAMGDHTITGLDTVIAENFSKVAPLDTQYVVGNVRIEVCEGATTATATATTLAQHYPPGEGVDPANTRHLSAGVRYLMDLVWVEGEGLWKLSRMEVKVLWQEGDRSVVPV